MKFDGKDLLICDCEGTMPLDARVIAGALGIEGEAKTATHLCRKQIEEFQRRAGGAGAGGELLVACTQEAPLFLETLEAMGEGAPAASFVNIRERAGWFDGANDKASARNAAAKMAALIAETAVEPEPALSVTMTSGGVTLVLGKDEDALDAAKTLAGSLDVTVVMEEAAQIIPPALADVPVFKGKITGAGGRLGAFQVRIERFAAAKASSRGVMDWDGAPQAGASECDLILDLRGGPALFPHADKRDGYFNPDPKNPAAVWEAIYRLSGMAGEFEKPRYVDYDHNICAHSRSKIIGCSRCIDNCPAGAVTPDGDRVKIDPYICGGCGVCASVCPTGAASYALPRKEGLFQRLRVLLQTYLKAGGADPVVLFTNQRSGDETIGLMARLGKGLPGNVIPVTVNETTQVGLDAIFSAMAYGASRALSLIPAAKREEAGALAEELKTAEAVFEGLGYGSGRTGVIDAADPAQVEDELWSLPALSPMPAGDFLPLGKKRAIMRLALDHLHKNAPNQVAHVDLEAGAPFGQVQVDTSGCTLCLSCVGACPANALRDNPDKPQLSFVEDACVQCGLCKNTCPEKVIRLKPRLSFEEASASAVVIKAEEPFHCVRCGKPYGTHSSIRRMEEKLKGHTMFAGGGIVKLKMCDDCRVVVQFDEKQPLSGAPRPPPRTTDDYLREREQLREAAKADMDLRGMKTEGED